MLPQSRYAALLVSMHGTALYERRDLRTTRRVRAFLDGQAELQARLLETLRADPRTAPFAADEIVRRNQQLVWRWDSLVARAAAGVGSSSGSTRGRSATTASACAARDAGSAGRFDDEEAMRAALDAAPWVTLELELAR